MEWLPSNGPLNPLACYDSKANIKNNETGQSFLQDGVVSTGEDYFIIKPLPKKYWKPPYDVLPHVIVRKNKPSNDHTQILRESSDNALRRRWLISSRRSRRAVPGFEVRIETAVFVDRDLFRHMSSNFPVNTERQLLRFVLAMVNAVSISLSNFEKVSPRYIQQLFLSSRCNCSIMTPAWATRSASFWKDLKYSTQSPQDCKDLTTSTASSVVFAHGSNKKIHRGTKALCTGITP